MASIYRYEIVNLNARENINLSEYKNDILATIKTEFGSDLKDCFVSHKYYEFKIFRQLSNEEKREFGKKLLRECHNLKIDIDRLKIKDSSGYFRRMKQKYYAFLNTNGNNLLNNIELIDAIDFQNIDDLLEKSETYIKSLDFGIQQTPNDNFSALQISFYMDTFSLNINSKLRDKSFNSSSIVLIEGYSKNTIEDDYLTINNDDNPKIFINEFLEGFQITKILKQNKDEIKHINEILELNLKKIDDIELLNYENPDGITFHVHNVGQALCTSLVNLDELPIMFFDFGISKDVRTHKVIEQYIKQYPPIFISHLHRDHWNGINTFNEAYKCKWLIPEQNLKSQFRKKCAQIIFMGGSVELIKNDIDLNFGKIIPALSTFTSTKHFHETGIILNLNLFDKNNVLKHILIAGDQRYANIDKKYLHNIDILIASHHGGEYYNSRSSATLNLIPLAKVNSLIIYSANYTRPYLHPSHKKDYQSRGWIKKHTTYINKDYTFK